jgi:S1-C subfamily serine protease
MKPSAAVQALLSSNEVGKTIGIAGSCFRLWSPNHFVTANHCVQDRKPNQLQVMNCLSDNQDLSCVAIYKHPKADIAVLEIEGLIPEQFERFKLADRNWLFGDQIHCFGMVRNSDRSFSNVTQRVVGGIIQRDFVYNDGVYESTAVELSAPIPTGMSGGPAFFARKPDVAMGVAIATVKSELVVSSVEEYEDNRTKQRERVVEITRYGVVLRLLAVKDWLEEIMPKEACL